MYNDERSGHMSVHRSFTKAAVGIVAILALIGLVMASTAWAHPGLKLDKKDLSSKACKADDAKQLVNVHYTLTNDYDSGFAGNAWANDTIDRQLRIWQLPDGSFCSVVKDHGKFVTFAGASPSGFSTVSADLKGQLEGGYVSTVFSGTYAPTMPTRGNLGTFDLMCDAAFNCPGDHPSFTSYISGSSGFDFAQWGWIYHAGKHGTWLNQDDVAAANSGDITG
jgi:hypothetical protein